MIKHPFSKNILKHSLLTTIFLLGSSQIDASPIEESTWIGTYSQNIANSANWDNNVPYDGIAIFNGNGENSPLCNHTGLAFQEIQFTAPTEVAITANLQTNGEVGVFVTPGVTATFDIYEHQYPIFPEAYMTINNGSPGIGGGSVSYNLEGYGQLYTSTGSQGSTSIQITMTRGYNYLEINGADSVFETINATDETDEVFIALGANLTINGDYTSTIDGQITGNGSLTKEGKGLLVLNNLNNSYSGDTFLTEGILQVNGLLLGNVSTSLNTVLQGSGNINGTVSLGGIISPGNSIGILTVNSITFTDSSVFNLEIDPLGDSDQIVASNEIVLDGTLNIIPLDLSFTSPQTYQIVQAGGGISGTFSNIQSTIPALTALQYGPDGVSLLYLPLSALNLQGTAASAANCFLSVSGFDMGAVSAEILSLPFSGIRQAFNQMNPSQFSGQTWTQLSNAILVRSSYSKHLEEFSLRKNCSSDFQSDVWVDGLGQWQKQDQKENQIGYNDWTGGVSLGTDTSYKNFRFGGAASYTHSGVHLSDSAGKGRINSYYGGLYGGWSDGVGYVSFSTLGSYNHYNTSRHMEFGHINRYANGSHNGWEFLSGIEAGAHFKTKYLRVGPFGRFDYVYLWQQGYQEKGAGSLNLHIKSRQDQLIQSQAGIVFTNVFKCSPESSNGTFIPRLEISYINQTPLGKTDYVASFEDSSCQFSVAGSNFERNLGAIGASLTYLTPSNRIGISLQYDGQFATKYSNQMGNVYFNVKY